jgi:hypothetical protein
MINFKNLVLILALFLFISCGGKKEEDNGVNLIPNQIVLNQAQEDELDLIAILAPYVEETGNWETKCETY